MLPTLEQVEKRNKRLGLHWLTNVANPCGYQRSLAHPEPDIVPRTRLEGGLDKMPTKEDIATLRSRHQRVRVDYAFDEQGNFIKTRAAIYVSRKLL